ncbi:hypothetical protein [Microbacterium gorillae]|uniref:hypothetical protein n=1 Tax=Microbacterium gorillae TaxID=1231063 RepID=UPI003D995041
MSADDEGPHGLISLNLPADVPAPRVPAGVRVRSSRARGTFVETSFTVPGDDPLAFARFLAEVLPAWEHTIAQIDGFDRDRLSVALWMLPAPSVVRLPWSSWAPWARVMGGFWLEGTPPEQGGDEDVIRISCIDPGGEVIAEGETRGNDYDERQERLATLIHGTTKTAAAGSTLRLDLFPRGGIAGLVINVSELDALAAVRMDIEIQTHL